jgi:hypothetical protein
MTDWLGIDRVAALLQDSAAAVAAKLGHELRPWARLAADIDAPSTNRTKWIARCRRCGQLVTVHPRAFGTPTTTGEPLAMRCEPVLRYDPEPQPQPATAARSLNGLRLRIP